MKKILCIYHSHCWDGLAAAWALRKGIQVTRSDEEASGIFFLAAQYSDPQPTLEKLATYDEVYIVDFSYAPAILFGWAMMLEHTLFTVIDHHDTFCQAWLEFGNERKRIGQTEEIPNLAISLSVDNSNSGAMLTWKYFFDLDIAPEFLELIEDRDLWRFKFTRSRFLHAYLSSQKYDFTVLDSLCNNVFLDDACSAGAAVLEYREQLHLQFVSQLTRSMTLELDATSKESITGLAVNCPGQFASEVGNILAIKSGTFGATYCTNSDGDTVISLRSTKDSGVHVGNVAKLFGGGGHANAAGFTLPGEEKEVNVWLH